MRFCILLIVWLFATTSLGADWITEPSYYTHNRKGQRVTQYAPVKASYVQHYPYYYRSYNRHYHSRINVNGSSDTLHIMEGYGYPYGWYGYPYRGWYRNY